MRSMDKRLFTQLGVQYDEEMQTQHGMGYERALEITSFSNDNNDAFIISPVNKSKPEVTAYLLGYIAGMASKKGNVHYPLIHTKQEGDNVGLRICLDNRQAIREHSKIHLYYDHSSVGTVFDLGMAFMNQGRETPKPLVMINPSALRDVPAEKRNLADLVWKWSENIQLPRDSVMYDDALADKQATLSSDPIIVQWLPEWNRDGISAGTLFRFGMAFEANKRIYVPRMLGVKRTESKSFSNMLIELSAGTLGKEKLSVSGDLALYKERYAPSL